MALLAVINPTISPRRAVNHRVATVAPSTSAVMPVPTPTTTPQSSISCQSSVMTSDPPMPSAISTSAVATTRRSPKTFIVAAANGPSSPKSSSRIASAEEICSVVQPNSERSGAISTPADPMAPAVASMVRNVTPATTQP